jgi:hypothetical protein
MGKGRESMGNDESGVVRIHANMRNTLALPVVLAHSAQIRWMAAAMSIVGGLLIYGTIIAFSMFFQEEQEF